MICPQLDSPTRAIPSTSSLSGSYNVLLLQRDLARFLYFYFGHSLMCFFLCCSESKSFLNPKLKNSNLRINPIKSRKRGQISSSWFIFIWDALKYWTFSSLPTSLLVWFEIVWTSVNPIQAVLFCFHTC